MPYSVPSSLLHTAPSRHSKGPLRITASKIQPKQDRTSEHSAGAKGYHGLSGSPIKQVLWEQQNKHFFFPKPHRSLKTLKTYYRAIMSCETAKHWDPNALLALKLLSAGTFAVPCPTDPISPSHHLQNCEKNNASGTRAITTQIAMNSIVIFHLSKRQHLSGSVSVVEVVGKPDSPRPMSYSCPGLWLLQVAETIINNMDFHHPEEPGFFSMLCSQLYKQNKFTSEMKVQ